jgi:glycosyltransferase involved in cell wall biosynthesis
MENNLPITVVVSVKNEELNLSKCLKCLKNFSQVIVVDSNSTDKTPEIVRSFGYKLVNFNWNGKFPKKRNWTLENVNIKNDWVLFLDADEYLTKQFINEVSAKIDLNEHTGYWIYYNNFFLGEEQKYGLKMRKLALFKKDFGRFEQINEDNWSHLDMEIHEHPIINGSIGKIKSTIIHKDYNSLEHYISKHNSYSSWEANRYLSLKKDKAIKLTLRQQIKYNLIENGLLPYLYFFGTYILKAGFLDGMSGYYFARFKLFYFFQIQVKIKEYKKHSEKN